MHPSKQPIRHAVSRRVRQRKAGDNRPVQHLCVPYPRAIAGHRVLGPQTRRWQDLSAQGRVLQRMQAQNSHLKAWRESVHRPDELFASFVRRMIVKKAYAGASNHLHQEMHGNRLEPHPLGDSDTLARYVPNARVGTCASKLPCPLEIHCDSDAVIADWPIIPGNGAPAVAENAPTILPSIARDIHPALPSGASPSRATPKISILIVDDDLMMAESMQQVLSEHHVDISIDAHDALVQIQAGRRYNLIFCDMMMPEMAGMEFYDHVNRCASEQARRIVFMTGGAFTERARNFLRSTENLSIEKPFDVDQLLGLIRERLLQTSAADYETADCPQGA